MQLITLASAAALLATASATVSVTSFNLNSTCDESQPKVRVYNRCSYPVHLWSVLKGQGCPASDGAVIETGGFYQENFRPAVDKAGTSLKMSKTPQCKGVDCLQLEYYIETDSPGFNYNYLDVSYVDCTGGDCPTKKEGFYLKSGNENGQFLANSLNQICPILSCSNAEECAKVAYILPDDVQTKSCSPEADLNFYLCGGEAPGSEPSYSSPAPSSSSQESAEEPAATSSETPSSTEEVVAAAAITSAPAEQAKPSNIKTEVVYVTQYEYVNAKRHAHGHRHQHFRA